MKIFAKAFQGVPDGEIYPVEYKVGDECPQELEAGALELGALAKDPLDEMGVADLKSKLDDAKVVYKASASKAELVALLKAAGAQ